MLKINTQIKKLIQNNPIAFATIGDGKPNVIGVAYVKVVAPNKVLVTDNFMKKTKDNLDKNRNVCMAVWDKKWNGIKLVGRAQYFGAGKWKRFVGTMSENKNMPAKGAILITVSKIINLR